MKLINKEFPWIHVVRGKPRKPSTQGSIEVSHRAFKTALCKWLDRTGSDDWIMGASIVQCEVNNCPMRVRGNISPYSIYFGKPPTASYSALLGKAYKVATTEFGLRLAKRVLEQVKKVTPNTILQQDQVEQIIKSGDEVWEQCEKDDEADSEDLLTVSFYSLLDDIGIKLPDNAVVVPDVEDTVEPDVAHVVDTWEPDDLPAYTQGTNDVIQEESQTQNAEPISVRCIASLASNEDKGEGKWHRSSSLFLHNACYY